MTLIGEWLTAFFLLVSFAGMLVMIAVDIVDSIRTTREMNRKWRAWEAMNKKG